MNVNPCSAPSEACFGAYWPSLHAYIVQVPSYILSIKFLQADLACCVLLLAKTPFLGLGRCMT